MKQPESHECALYQKILESLEESGKTDSSYYVLVKEAVRLCRAKEPDERQ